MKPIIIISTLIVVILAETTCEDIVIEDVVADTESFKSAVDCFMGKYPCSQVEARFKATIPEIVKQACAKCSDDQKHMVRVFIAGLKEKWPQDYEKLVEQYDPEKKLFAALESAVSSY